MECPRESRKRLRPWLERMVNCGECPGLVWEDKEKRTFRIPWRHFNNRDWLEKDSKIFMEWAKYTGKYQENKIEYPVWKTRLRCALKKIPEIKELPERHQLDDADPYRVYQFVDAPVMKKGDTDSDDGHSPASVSSSYCCNSPYQRRDCNEGSPSPPPNFLYGRPGTSANVPTVVYDENLYVPVAEFNNLTGNSNFLQHTDRHIPQTGTENYNMQAPRESDAPQGFNLLPGHDFLTGSPPPSHNLPCFNVHTESEQPKYMELTSSFQNMAHPSFPASTSQARSSVAPEGTTSLERVSYSNQESMKTSLPSDLRSVDSMDLFCEGANMPLPQSISSLDAQSTHHSFGYQASNERQAEAAPENPGQMVSWAPQGGSYSLCEPSMKLTILYGSPQHFVQEEMATAKGCRIFFGRPQLSNTIDQEDLYGPQDVEQIEVKDVGKCQDIRDEQKGLIRNLLGGMERGVVLTFKNGDIYARRLCRTRIFKSDGVKESLPLDRKNEDPMKVFDFKAFKDELKKFEAGMSQVRPKSDFILTFGQEIKKSLPSPLGKVLFCITVQHTQAQEALSEGPDYSLSNNFSMLSSCDPYDKILENFRNVNISE